MIAEATKNIEELYSLAEPQEFEIDLSESNLDHDEVGTFWYGINEQYKDQILDTDQSEWLVVLSLDINKYYDEQ